MNRSTDQRAKFFRGLHAEAAKRGLDHAALHELVSKRYGVDSLRKLSDAQLRDWYREFTGRGFKHAGVPGAARRHAAGKAGRRGTPDTRNLTPAIELVDTEDLVMMRDFARMQLGWSAETLDKFIRRQIGRDAIRTMAEFNKVLWGLKAMKRRRGVR